jgi:hypothetical protein
MHLDEIPRFLFVGDKLIARQEQSAAMELADVGN